MIKWKKTSRRELKLQSFVKTPEGDYQYIGSYYQFSFPGFDFSRARRLSWLCAAVMLLSILLCGLLPLSAWVRTAYVVLPYGATLVITVLELWTLIRICYWGSPLREYVYRETVGLMHFRFWLHCAFAAITFVGHLVFFLVSYPTEPLLPALTFQFLLLPGIAGALLMLRLLDDRAWQLE